MKKRMISVSIAVATISLLIALVLAPPWGSVKPAVAETLKSDLPRIASPDIDPADQARLIEGNTAFAFDLYQELRDRKGNLFYSPHSISVALAMTYAGARAQTAEQMARTLQFLLEQEGLHAAFNWLDTELATRGEGDEGFTLNVVNAIWGQKGYDFLDAFLDVLAENYGAGLRVLDFVEETEPSRIAINRWVSDETEGRIEDLIPPDAINPLTRLVLTNAIYLDASWKHPFDKDSDGPFYLLDGGQVTVPMMKQTEALGHTSGQGYQAVELQYDGGELSMVILLPDSGQFDTFEKQLDAQLVASIIEDIQSTPVALTMPKFEFESDFNLKAAFQAMGMTDAFVWNTADFSGMTGDRDLFISDVVHKAFVSVDEEGTEAAAATGVVIAPTAMPPDPDIEVKVDRPFIFLIRDIETGAILFLGRVTNPAA